MSDRGDIEFSTSRDTGGNLLPTPGRNSSLEEIQRHTALLEMLGKKPMLSAAELCQLMGWSRRSLSTYIVRKKVPTIRLTPRKIIFDREAVIAHLGKYQVNARN